MKLAILYGAVFAAAVFMPEGDRFGYFMGVAALSIAWVIDAVTEKEIG